MKSRSQRSDTEKLPWGVPAVIVVWVIWLVLAHLSRAVLDFYTAISPLRYLGAANVPNLRNLIFAPGMLVAIALLVPVLIAAGIAFRIVASRYRGAPMEALAFTRQSPVWMLAVVVLFGVLLTFLLQFALGWSNYPLPFLNPTLDSPRLSIWCCTP